MQPEVSKQFSLLTIELRKFSFDQVGQPLNAPLHFNINTAAKAKKNTEGFLIVLELSIKAIQSDTELYNSDATILSMISVKEDFDKSILNNVVAIMYSYLRPLIAQMTVMAKLPPLDIPPVNFSQIKIEIEN